MLVGLAQVLPVFAESTLTSSEQQRVALYKRCSPGVVIIKAFRGSTAAGPQEVGVGWVFDEEGHIVTGWQNVRSSNKSPTVVFSEGTEVQAKVVAVDSRSDVAVLQVDLLPEQKQRLLRPLSIGSSANLEVGQEVVLIGDPLGVGLTPSTGLVSALDRPVIPPPIAPPTTAPPLLRCIMTDAYMQAGNGGSPLLNSKGEVIGMLAVTFVSQNGLPIGLSFASPSDLVAAEVASLLKYGYVKRPSLGVYLEQDGFALQTVQKPGCTVASVRPQEAAGKVGVVKGDVIYEVAGKPTPDAGALYQEVNAHRPGESVEVKLLRPSKDDFRVTSEVSVKVPLGEALPDDAREW